MRTNDMTAAAGKPEAIDYWTREAPALPLRLGIHERYLRKGALALFSWPAA